ncbi:PTS transporter subunit EIIB [Mycoplasmopsis opalescens]|uniref:PTS transporter subunit EIIB n=1 Tax=Mycoplasmopsis opalescens TaxID=114886 RepID=UPI0004A72754|nr:PTS transporter subunit EIIB [Mycoplasmopsis opalescens]
MKRKDKFLIVLLTIFTLGFCWLYWHVKNKQKLKMLRGETKAKTTDSEIEKLILFLGGKDNINEVHHTTSSLKVIINNKNKVEVENLKKIKGVSGLLISTNKVSLVCGEFASVYAEKIKYIIS